MKTSVCFVIVVLIACFAHAESRYFDPAEIGSLALGPSPSGTTYYVCGATGNNSWNGRYPTYQGGSDGPWRTIQYAFDASGRVNYGDHLLIKAGTYNERIYIKNIGGTGSEDNRFKMGPYGDGEVILKADYNHLLSWSVHSGNIYKFTYNFNIDGSSRPVRSVVMDDIYNLCKPKTSLDAVTQDGHWYWDAAQNTCYLYSSSGTPNSRQVIINPDLSAVSSGYRPIAVVFSSRSYVTLFGISIKGSPDVGLYDGGNSRYITLHKCRIMFSGNTSLNIRYNRTYSGSVVDKCYIHANVYTTFPRGRPCEYGYVNSIGGSPSWTRGGMDLGPGATLRGSIVCNQGGEGVNYYNISDSVNDGVLIEDNIIYDNMSVSVYPDSADHATIRRNIIFNNVPLESDIWEGLSSANKVTARKKMHCQGIMLGFEAAYSDVLDNTFIYDNLIIGCRNGVTLYTEKNGFGFRNVHIYGNTIITPTNNPKDPLYGMTYTGIDLVGSGSYSRSDTDSYIRNNIVIGQHANTDLMKSSSAVSEILLSHNLYYHPNNSSPFVYDGSQKTFSQWKSSSADSSTLNQDPRLASSGPYSFNPNTRDYSHLRPTSICPGIGQGFVLGSPYDTDFDNVARGAAFDIGALEYVEEEVLPTVSFASASSSGTKPQTNAWLTVQLNETGASTVTVQYAATGGTAVNGVDYGLAAGALSFPPGTTSRTILITVTNDLIDEPDKTIEVTLSNPTHATRVAPYVHTYTILGVPGTSVYFSVGTATHDLKAGAGLTVTIADGKATFSAAQSNHVGVGDVFTYDATSKAYISGRWSPTEYAVVTARGGRPPNISGSAVVSIRRAFSSISNALHTTTGIGGASFLNTTNLAANNYQVNLALYADGAFDGNTLIGGYQPGPDHVIKFYTPWRTNQVGVSQRHNGTVNQGVKFSSNATGHLFHVDMPHVHFEGVICTYTEASHHNSDETFRVNATGFRLSHSIIYDINHIYSDAVYLGADNLSVYIWNCLFYNIGRGAALNQGRKNCQVYVYNCTIHNSLHNNINYETYSSCGHDIAYDNSGSLFMIRNVLAHRGNTNGSRVFKMGASGSYSGSYAVASDATASNVHATLFRNNTTFTDSTAAPAVIFESIAGADFRLKDHVNNLALLYATNLSADAVIAFTDDILGNERPAGQWDCGAFQCSGLSEVFHTLTYTAGEGGSIVGVATQIVAHGASGSAVTAQTNLYYRFVQWNDGRTDNPRTDTNVVADLHVTAEFAPLLAALGTPHIWLALHGYSGDFDIAELTDDDQDGAKAWEEYLADTDPLDSNDVFRISGFRQPDAKAVIFGSSIQRLYSLQTRPALTTGSWLSLPDQTAIPGQADGWTTLMDTNAAETGAFYRVRVTLP